MIKLYFAIEIVIELLKYSLLSKQVYNLNFILRFLVIFYDLLLIFNIFYLFVFC